MCVADLSLDKVAGTQYNPNFGRNRLVEGAKSPKDGDAKPWV